MPEQTGTAPGRSMKRIGAAAACGLLACTIGAGAAAAYLTGIATAENPFTLDANLKIELSEPSFSAAAAKDLKPLQSVAKDPTITNTGSVTAYVAADVKVPVFSGSAIKDGTIAELTDADLFSYTVNNGWKQIGEAQLADGFRTYRYVYDAELAAGAKTPSVFDAVTVANLTEDVGISETTIDITAHAIQSEGFANATDACSAYDAQARLGVTMSA